MIHPVRNYVFLSVPKPDGSLAKATVIASGPECNYDWQEGTEVFLLPIDYSHFSEGALVPEERIIASVDETKYRGMISYDD